MGVPGNGQLYPVTPAMLSWIPSEPTYPLPPVFDVGRQANAPMDYNEKDRLIDSQGWAMNRKQLEYFLEICRTGNITSAADNVYLTKQALSRTIKVLEDELGSKIFRRTVSGVILTSEGARFKVYAEQERQLFDQLLRDIHGSAHRLVIRLGAHLSHRTDTDIRSFLAYENIEPDVSIKLIDVEEHIDSWAMLHQHELDVVVSRTKPQDDSLVWVQNRVSQVVVIMSSEHLLAHKEQVDFINDLGGQTYYSMSRNTLKELGFHFESLGITGEYVTPNRGVLRNLLESGSGVFVVPQISAKPFLTPLLVQRPLERFPLDVGVYFVVRRESDPAIRRYVTYLDQNFPNSKNDFYE
jgi:DNA-binding transcriptional LysR family regulator